MNFRLLIFLFLVSSAVVAEPLRTIAAIKDLSIDEAARRKPVEIEMLVLKVALNGNSFFAHDEQKGIYVSLPHKDTVSFDLDQGCFVLVKGYTAPGKIYPHIVAESVEFIKRNRLFQAFPISREQMSDPSIDCSWVRLEGVVTECVPAGEIISIRLQCFGDLTTSLVIGRTPETEAKGKALVNSKITAYAIAVIGANSQRQMVRRYFQVNSFDDIVMREPVGQPPLKDIELALKSDFIRPETIRIQGSVTHVHGSQIYLQDHTAGLMIQLPEPTEIQRFDKIEVQGLMGIKDSSPILRAKNVTKLESQGKIEALPVTFINDEIPVNWHHQLLEVDAELLEIRRSNLGLVLTCDADSLIFECILKSPQIERISYEIGSQLRLLGIGVLRSSVSDDPLNKPDRLSLILRDDKDITLLKSPPWWTIGKVLVMLTGVALLAGAALAWGALLKRRVSYQTAVISSQIEREATHKERQRLARELHDSVEQNMGSLALQLASAQRYQELGHSEKLSGVMGLAQKTLAHCQRESRQSIYDLRRGEGTTNDSWRDEFLIEEYETAGSDLEIYKQGRPFTLPKQQQQHAIKIVREAALNALRHGKATKVKISYEYNEAGLTIQIIDNGSGFDADRRPPKGHFGIIGMRERAVKMKAQFEIESTPGEGTTILLRINKPTTI